MALTAAQLTTFDTNVNFGIQPTAAEALLISAWAQQTQAANLTDVQAEEDVLLNPAGTTLGATDVALATYQFFTGSAPTLAGLQYLVNGDGNPNDLGSAYYAGFNTENRYYNFAINLATDPSSSAAAAFAANYGSVSFSDAVIGAYEAIVGSATVGATFAASAEAAITAEESYFAQVAAERAPNANQDLATKAIMIGYILEEALKANVGAYAFAVNSFDLALGTGGTPAYGMDLLTSYPINSVGQTFNLTAGIDHFVGGSGNDTFSAVSDAVNGPVISSLDYIDGGAGTNTFSIVDNTTGPIQFGTVGNDGFDPVSPLITLMNVQTVNIQSEEANILVDLTGDAALQTVTASVELATASTTIIGGQTVTATGGEFVEIASSALVTATVNNTSGDDIIINNYDAATHTFGDGATLTSVTLSGVNNEFVEIGSSSLSTLTLNSVGTVSGVDIEIQNELASAPVLTLNANGTDVFIDDVDAGPGTGNPEIDLVATGANLIDIYAADTTTFKVSGAGSVDLTGSTLTAVTTFNASANSGGVTVTDDFAAGATVIGGSGNDVVFLTAATGGGSISLGAGNDSLLENNGLTGSITPGTTVDGGSGTNTISAYLVNAGDASFITNFQILDVSNYGTSPHNGLDGSLMGTRPTGLAISTANTTGLATILNLADNATVTDVNSTGTATTNGVSLTGNIELTHVDGAGTLAVGFDQMASLNTLNDILNITSTGDTAVTVNMNAYKHDTGTLFLTETDNHLATITISGGNHLYLDTPVIDSGVAAAASATNIAAALTVINATSLTGDFNVEAGGPQTPSANNTVTFTGLVIDGGSGDNVIENDAAGGVINVTSGVTGDINDLYVTAAGATVNDSGSVGTDFIEVGLGGAVPGTLTGQSATVSLGSGTGTEVIFHDVAGAAPGFFDALNTGAAVSADIADYLHYYETVAANSILLDGNVLAITGSVTGHELDFANALSNPAGNLGLVVNVGAAQNLGQAVYLADQATTAHDQAVWFQYGGSDYILVGDHTGALHDTTQDQVVKIVGSLADLTHAQVTGGHLVF